MSVAWYCGNCHPVCGSGRCFLAPHIQARDKARQASPAADAAKWRQKNIPTNNSGWFWHKMSHEIDYDQGVSWQGPRKSG